MRIDFLKLRTCAVILIIGILAGYMLLSVSFAFNGKHFEEHMQKSALVFESEGGYPSLGIKNSTLDNFTDALMLETASYSGDENPFEKAAASYRNFLPDAGSPHEQIVALHLDEDVDRTKILKTSYARYWHGYAVPLRFALEFMSYNWIRRINTFAQCVLFAILLILILQKLQVAILPFILMAAFFVPEAVNKSIQFSTSTYVMLISVTVILCCHEKILTNKKYIEFFLITGMATSYLDLLTFPSVTLSLPLCFLFCLNKNLITLKEKMKFLFLCCVAWVAGYGGMWTGKWIIAFVFQGKEFMQSTISAIEFRSSANYNEIYSYGRFATIFHRMKECLIGNPAIFVVWFVVALSNFIPCVKPMCNRNKFVGLLENILPYVFMALIPCIWIFVMCNHACIHWFTFRNFAPITFIVLMCITDLNSHSLQNKAHI